ncbi:MAG: ribosome silencing factor [Pirellulales bacterium]
MPESNLEAQSTPSGQSVGSERSLQLAVAAAQTAELHRGRDIVVLDLRQLTAIVDYFVIVTGTSRRQLRALAEEIDSKLQKGLGDRRLGMEGFTESQWILLDYGNIVVHLFDEETRSYFALESLWGEGRRVAWESYAPV